MKVTQEGAVWYPSTEDAYHSILMTSLTSEKEIARHYYKQGRLEISPNFAYLLPKILQAVANSNISSKEFDVVAHNILWRYL